MANNNNAYGSTEPFSSDSSSEPHRDSSSEPHRDERGMPMHRDAVGLDDNAFFRRANQTSQPNRFMSWKRVAALSLVGVSVFYGTGYLNGYNAPSTGVTGDAVDSASSAITDAVDVYDVADEADLIGDVDVANSSSSLSLSGVGVVDMHTQSHTGAPPSTEPDAAATAGDDDSASDADVNTVKSTKTKKGGSSDTDATTTIHTKETHDKASTQKTKQTHTAKTEHTPTSCGKGCAMGEGDDDATAAATTDDDLTIVATDDDDARPTTDDDDDATTVRTYKPSAAPTARPTPGPTTPVASDDALRDGNRTGDADGVVKKQKPHLFLITLDDVGNNDISWQSNDMPGASPILGSLAKDGIILNNYYGQATCTPARSTIMSGKFTHRTGFQDQEITVYSDYSLAINMTLLPSALVRGGYKAYGVGKWNLGHCNIAYMPWNRGFDKFFTQTMSGIHYYNHTHDSMHFNGTTYDLFDLLEGEANEGYGTFKPALDVVGTYSTNVYQNQAESYIKAHNEAYPPGTVPMFLWLAFHGVHSDGGDPKWFEMSEKHQKYIHSLKHQGSDADRLRTAMAMLVLDDSIDKVVQNLDSYGMLSNSVIVVHSDNGGVPCGDTANNMQGSNFPLRGGKFNYFEGGLKVPAMVYAPGLLKTNQKGTTYNGLMHHVDWYTTFMAIADIEVNHGEMQLDGFDHWDAMRGIAPEPRDEIMFNLNQVFDNVDYGFENASVAYRYKDMKLLLYHSNDTWYNKAGFITYSTSGSDACVERSCSVSERYTTAYKDNLCKWGHFLFNITADPTEEVNLYYEDDYQRTIDGMMDKIKNHHKNEYWQSTTWSYTQSDEAMTEFYNHNNYVVPWGCPVSAAEH